MPAPAVVAVYITPAPGGQPAAVAAAEAVADAGLVGDRYLVDPPGSRDRRTCDVTLIESEAIDAVARDHGVTIDAGDARRNIVTRDVPLNHLVGREFTVGDVALRGVAISEPCTHLAGFTYPEITDHLRHRAGLEARILRGGTIRPGDPIAY